MSDSHLEDFDPRKFVKGLSSAQLEMMAELYDEAAAGLRLLTRSGKSFKAPTGQDMLRVFQVAGSELLERLAPDVDPEDQPAADTEQTLWRGEDDEEADDGEQESKKRIPKNADSEWLRELGGEIQAKRKGLALPVVATVSEIRALFEAAAKESHRNYLIIRTLYASGIRREEVVNLRVADLYAERNILFIREGKWDKDRYVLIDADTSRLLLEYTRDFLLTDQIFDLSTRTINRVVNAAAEQTGLRQRFAAMGHKFHVHTLRHTYATHMYESGADLFLLKTLLGHLNLKVTRTYVHIGVKAFSDRYNQHHPLANGAPALTNLQDLDLQEDED